MDSAYVSFPALQRRESIDNRAMVATSAACETVARLNRLVRENCLNTVLAKTNCFPFEWNEKVVASLFTAAQPPRAEPPFALDWESREVVAKIKCSFRDSVSGKPCCGWVRVVVDPVPLCDATSHARSYVLKVQQPYEEKVNESEYELRHPLVPCAKFFYKPHALA